jgi:PAS domain S-box-containing protein
VYKGRRKEYNSKKSPAYKGSQSRTMGNGEGIGDCPVSFAQVLKSLPFPFYVIDASNYIIKAANPSAKFGRLSNASTCYALTHKSDKPCGSAAHPCPLAKIKNTRKPVTVQHVHFDKAGNSRNVEVHAFPVLDDEGKVSHIIEYVQDITKRKRAELDLRNSEERFRRIAENAEEWIWEVDADGYYTYSSPVVEKLLGWQPSQIVGKKHFYDFYLPPLREVLKEAAFQIISEKKPFRKFINFNVHSNGKIVVLETSGVPILDGSGNLLGYRGTDSDITERKRAEDALQKAHDELKTRVDQHTAELLKSYKERAFIRETFGTYLSDEVVAEILAIPEGVELGGEMRDMTILVSDLRGFTVVTEGMEASEIVKIINRYLDKMVPIIMRHQGTIDEFTGDGILVFFGAPRRLPDHPSRAVVCALEMQGSMKELNEKNLGLGLPQVEMGIAISCGQLAVGNIGSQKRRKYGAVGSSINVAFRLVEKARPGEIVVTQAVKDRLGDILRTNSVWKENLKGIGNTLIYRVIGIKGD